MAYVYRHMRSDTRMPFYIGIGSDSKGKFTRANSINNRNRHWYFLVSKHGFYVEIVLDDITREQALEKEIELILLYGRNTTTNGLLVNLTDGGECGGSNLVGYKHTEIAKSNMSKAQQGKFFSKEHRAKIAATVLKSFADGTRKPSVLTEDGRRRISKAKKGSKHSEASIMKMRESAKNKPPVSDETKAKLKAKKPVKHTDETKKRIGMKNKQRIDSELRYRIVVTNEHGQILGRFRSYEETAKSLKISAVSIKKVINGDRESISGYKYKREDFLS